MTQLLTYQMWQFTQWLRRPLAVTARFVKGLSLKCHSQQIFIQPDPAIIAQYANSRPNIVRITNTHQWIRGPIVVKDLGAGFYVH
jgi:hypothetical protein